MENDKLSSKFKSIENVISKLILEKRTKDRISKIKRILKKLKSDNG